MSKQKTVEDVAKELIDEFMSQAPKDNEYKETLWWIGHSTFYDYLLRAATLAQSLKVEELRAAHDFGWEEKTKVFVLTGKGLSKEESFREFLYQQSERKKEGDLE